MQLPERRSHYTVIQSVENKTCNLLNHKVGIFEKNKEKNIRNVNMTGAEFVITFAEYYSIIFYFKSVLLQVCLRGS